MLQNTSLQNVRCHSCGDIISMSTAKLSEDSEFAMSAEDFQYFCPVCAIQAKNAAMQRQLLSGLKAS